MIEFFEYLCFNDFFHFRKIDDHSVFIHPAFDDDLQPVGMSMEVFTFSLIMWDIVCGIEDKFST